MTLETFSRSAWPVVRFDEIDSTNEEAPPSRHERATLARAGWSRKQQTAGRGTAWGAQWSSPRGNLFATALLPYPRPASRGDAGAVCGRTGRGGRGARMRALMYAALKP